MHYIALYIAHPPYYQRALHYNHQGNKLQTIICNVLHINNPAACYSALKCNILCTIQADTLLIISAFTVECTTSCIAILLIIRHGICPTSLHCALAHCTVHNSGGHPTYQRGLCSAIQFALQYG